MAKRVSEIMKLENGHIAVRWEGESEFHEIPDKEVSWYMLYLIIHGEEAVDNINSRLR